MRSPAESAAMAKVEVFHERTREALLKGPISSVASFPDNPEIPSLSALLELRDFGEGALSWTVRIEPLVSTETNPFLPNRRFELHAGTTLLLKGVMGENGR